MASKQAATSLRVSPVGNLIWEALTKRTGLSKGALIELLLRDEAVRRGLSLEDFEAQAGTEVAE
jgi:hypothetical protein